MAAQARTPIAALVSPDAVLGAALPDAPNAEADLVDDARDMLMPDGAEPVPVMLAEPDPAAPVGATLALPEAAPPERFGGGVALLGSASAPKPHGISSFVSGCVAFGGGVVEPSGLAMTKRVVQYWSDTFEGELNS